MPTAKLRLSFQYDNPLKKKMQEAFFETLPTTSGVYFMLDSSQSILYVGKAKNLKKRLLSYKNAKPGQVPERTIEMLERVEHIEWEEHPSETHALSREYDLIREVKPPFNIAGTESWLDLFIGFHVENDRVHLRLSSQNDFSDPYFVFGSYNHRRRAKVGYGALLRVLYAASAKGARFAFPAKITRASPAYTYSARWCWAEGRESEKRADELRRLLAGKSDRFLRTMVERLLENDAIPTFMHPGLQADIEALRRFYESLRVKTRFKRSSC